MVETMKVIEKMSVKDLNEYYASFGKETLKDEGLMSASDFRQLKKQQKIEHLENNNLFDSNIEQTEEEIKDEDALIDKRFEVTNRMLDLEVMSEKQLIDIILSNEFGDNWYEFRSGQDDELRP